MIFFLKLKGMYFVKSWKVGSNICTMFQKSWLNIIWHGDSGKKHRARCPNVNAHEGTRTVPILHATASAAASLLAQGMWRPCLNLPYLSIYICSGAASSAALIDRNDRTTWMPPASYSPNVLYCICEFVCTGAPEALGTYSFFPVNRSSEITCRRFSIKLYWINDK